jgi:hypothetical protein
MNFTVDNIKSAVTTNFEFEIQVSKNVMISRYFTAAGLFIILYDTVLTMEDEVSEFSFLGWTTRLSSSCTHNPRSHSCSHFLCLEVRLVWPGPFGVPKLLYFLNRYPTIASLIAGNYREYKPRPRSYLSYLRR